MDKMNGTTMDIVAENVEKLKELFPEAFTEGKVDFEALKEVLGDYTEGKEERYSFSWNGKSKSRMLAQTPSTGTLRPCQKESVSWEETKNIFIEGDNLEVLKLLQKSYYKKFKMIYIDPPYNTGKDFVYRDNFKDNIKNYKEITGQIDSQGRNKSSNPETSGRYHTDWLNMIYPRLKLARNLIKDDGVIFISIDGNEIANLIKLGNEVFGEENFISTIANINNPKGRSDDKFIATAHEYIVIYAKSISQTNIYGFEPDEKIIRRYNKEDSQGKVYREMDLRKTGDSDRREDRPDMFYYFYFNENKDTLRVSKEKDLKTGEIEIFPQKDDGSDGRWRWGFQTALDKIETVYAKFMPTRQIWGIFEMDYLEGRPPVKSTSSWTFKDVNSERGSEQFIELGFDKEVFQRPKPVGTLKRILEVGTLPHEESYILDFFAGSCGISQAIFELNANHNRNIHFVAVQLPEICDSGSQAYKDGFKYISDISKERIRRAAIKTNGEGSQSDLDTGFKVFKLDSSNIKTWDVDFDSLDESLLNGMVENIKDGRSEEDVLYEILIKYGLDLTLPITEHNLAGKKVFDIGMGALIICLSDSITLDVVEGIAKLKDQLNPEIMRVVFKDSGFKDDVVKTNAVQILKQAGIEDVRSL
ncbi:MULTISPECIES: site-specific DNA-methyltransferase [unclassified Oceanispirochaeta]|uniref:site-specific DNA-methyltransferase n=1 Tax=unclassified Oceanispirochaeta TaxID=2635722 RepID=UPI000E096504|nr:MULTISPECIES: site-specific DNA-methyltransferase [unclassified Oceanispirochaeta]MBF9016732.1 site-specific DNA-methyltransferase [Oceanispirochaeta sp. M2]NPD72002.1 site-specific DNA-methyltransferase [Oceanispirochaeta sp. M1]RDG32446.1 site-specific DNA-methyltransferase [Oceanispirochaeta sp. M1]